jgi:hypothetical protein
MKRTLLTITIVYLVFCSCAFYKAQIPGYFYDDGYYKNSSAGFKVHLPEDWEIGTTPKTVAKKELIKYLGTSLFQGRSDGSFFKRLIIC